MTGGGDCPGLNAAIRAVAKTPLLKFGLEVFGIEDGFLGLVENRVRPLRVGDVSGILTLGGTILGTSNKCDPRKHPRKGEGPNGAPCDQLGECVGTIRERGLDALVCIGGDGTMAGLAHFARAGVACIVVPKTIDNDIEGTDAAIGFATARSVATEALDRVHSTAMSHHRAMVVEVM